MEGSIQVQNYPLCPMTEEEMQALEKAIMDRKMEIQSKGTELPVRSRMTSRTSVPDSPKGASSRQGSSLAQDISENTICFTGSLSAKFIDLSSCYLLDQTGVISRQQIARQILLLKNVTRKLKQHFNSAFDTVYSKKELVLTQVQAWLRQLQQHSSYYEDSKYTESQFQLDPYENPELDLPKKDVTHHSSKENNIRKEKAKAQSSLPKYSSKDVAMEVIAPEFMVIEN